MAITFYQKRKLQRYLILVFILVLLITAFVLWQGFRQKEAGLSETGFFKPARAIDINFELLESPLLKHLEPFETIRPFEQTEAPEVKVGRGNPFLSY